MSSEIQKIQDFGLGSHSSNSKSNTLAEWNDQISTRKDANCIFYYHIDSHFILCTSIKSCWNTSMNIHNYSTSNSQLLRHQKCFHIPKEMHRLGSFPATKPGSLPIQRSHTTKPRETATWEAIAALLLPELVQHPSWRHVVLRPRCLLQHLGCFWYHFGCDSWWYMDVFHL